MNYTRLRISLRTMDTLCAELKQKFPCRDDVIKTLCELIGNAEEAYPSAIYLFGHSGTGKTAVTKEFLRQCKRSQTVRTVQLNCIECYTTKILLASILAALAVDVHSDQVDRTENLCDFLDQLRDWHDVVTPSESTPKGFLIALDHAERLRDMDANILPAFLQLQRLSGLNICVLLISQLPFEKYYCKTGLSEIITIHFPQYSKVETLSILSADFEHVRRIIIAQLKTGKHAQDDSEELTRRLCVVENITLDFFNNYLNVFLSVFYKACRDVPELKLTARKCFSVYITPVLDGSVAATDVTRLWRHIATPLREALAQVYMRIDTRDSHAISNGVDAGASAPLKTLDQSVRKQAQALELPYYGKFLLIAAFLASYNSAKEDKRLYVKNHGKQRKRMQSVNARAKVSDKMSTSLGPKSFTIDRLLAIFYAILDEKVGLTCNLLSQISTLVHLKLLSFVSGENNIIDGSARLQCTIGLEFVLYIGKVVDFNVRQYLCDFM